LERFDDAINHYIQAIKKNDDKKPDAYYNLGNAMCVKNQYKEAIKCFKKVIKYDSSNIDAIFNLGNCLFVIGKFKKAIEKYELCAKLNMNTYEVKISLAKSLIEIGEKDSLIKAESMLRAMLKEDNDNAELNMALSHCEEKWGNKEEALLLFKVKLIYYYLFIYLFLLLIRKLYNLIKMGLF
jgi:predicted Zn-dependent protease